jgi:hypothetical protein
VAAAGVAGRRQHASGACARALRHRRLLPLPDVADRGLRGAAAPAHGGGVLPAAGAGPPRARRARAARAHRRRREARRTGLMAATRRRVRWWWRVAVGRCGRGGVTAGAGVAQAVFPSVPAALLPQVGSSARVFALVRN